MTDKKEPKASMVLGILSICLFITTWPGMVLAIIGLSMNKSKEHKARDITLNVVGLILSSFYLLIVIGMMTNGLI